MKFYIERFLQLLFKIRNDGTNHSYVFVSTYPCLTLLTPASNGSYCSTA